MFEVTILGQIHIYSSSQSARHKSTHSRQRDETTTKKEGQLAAATEVFLHLYR